MSVRNNQDRVGNIDPGSELPVMQNTTEGAFSFPTPTEFVELPSRGRFYPENHPLHNQELVEIKYMTAKDEDILTSQSLIKKGIVVDRLLQSVIVDKTINPNQLLVGDKSAILVASRVTGYGSGYEVNVTCPACGESSDYEFDLEQIQRVNYGDGFDSDEARPTGNGTYVIDLPLTKISVEVRLLTGHDEAVLLKAAEKKKKLKLPESALTDQFRAIIVSVDDHKEQSTINSVVERLPARDARYLRGVYSKINPTVELKGNFECDNCGHIEEVDVPITVQFFWPKQ